MRKRAHPFDGANGARTYSECLVLTELAQLAEPKCLYGEGWLEGVTLLSKTCKRFAMFFQEI